MPAPPGSRRSNIKGSTLYAYTHHHNNRRWSFGSFVFLCVASVALVTMLPGVGNRPASLGHLLLASTSSISMQPPPDPEAIFEALQAKGEIRFNDFTMNLTRTIPRPWLQLKHSGVSNTNKKDMPKVRLILTDFGWNQHDSQLGLKVMRLKRSRELLQAFVDHPYFDPTFEFTPMANNITNDAATSLYESSVTNIVMLDLETCIETNYPGYGSTLEQNTDTQQGRVVDSIFGPGFAWDSVSKYVNKVLESRLFQNSPSSTLIFIECGSEAYWPGRFPPNLRQSIFTTKQFSFAAISANYKMMGEEADMGLPPPAVKPITLTSAEEHDIETCRTDAPSTQRQFFFTFVGTDRNPGDHGTRLALFQLNDPNQGVILMDPPTFESQFKDHSYASVLRASQFAATPRGDCMFSYRFTEVLSAGAIPVIHADGWVLPFRKELVDWTKCAVVIAEKDTPKTVEILRNIPEPERCRMRQKCYEIYQKYIVTPEKTMVGIVDSVLARNAAAAVKP